MKTSTLASREGLFVPKSKKRAAPAPTIRRCYAEQQQQRPHKHETPRKRRCLAAQQQLINSTESPMLAIPTLPVLQVANEPPQQSLFGDAMLLNLQNDMLIAQLNQDAQLNQLLLAHQQKEAQAVETRRLMDNLLALSGVRRVINGCVVERVYK